MRYRSREPIRPRRARTEIDKKNGGILAYLAWWLSGIVVLVLGREDPDIRYHASQSIVLFGGLTLVQVGLSVLGGILRGTWLAVLIFLVSAVVYLFWALAWLYCLFQAWNMRGRRFEVPLVNEYVTPYAEQLAEALQ